MRLLSYSAVLLGVLLVCTQLVFLADSRPSKVEGFDPDRVFNAAHLDDKPRGGSHASQGWVSPRKNNGSMLDLVGNGLREPINVIISGKSDPFIMSDNGLKNYVRSIGFSFECLHLHAGGFQRANLGDGRGYQPQLVEYRQLLYRGSPGVWVGACWESLAGGNHFRVWKQNGTLADTGAWFLAVSKEKSVAQKHTIVKNGYDIGRDELVEWATKGGSFADRSWKADVQYVDGLEPAGSKGIDHGLSIDGRVAVLTVRRCDKK